MTSLKGNGRRTRIAIRVLASVTAGMALVRCGTPLPTAEPSVVPPTSTPAPEIEVRLTRWRLTGQPPIGMGFLALEAGPESTEVVLEVRLVTDQGEVEATVQVSTLTSYLLQTSDAFFAVDFPEETSGTKMEVRVVSSRAAPEDVQSLDAEILDSHWLPDERLSLLGSVVNPFRRPVVPSALIAVGVDNQGQPLTYAPVSLPAGHLRPGEPVPFRADVPSAADVTEWVIVGHAVPSTTGGRPAVALQGELSIQRDPQGQLFAVGRISNGSDAPQWAQVGALLSLEDQWVSLGVFETPTVIPAGASLPFAIDIFPGAEEELVEHEADRGDLDVEPFLREAVATAGVREIGAEITRFEVIGSRLYLRGVARNHGTTSARACVVAAMLSDEGDLLTAGWTSPAESLSPGGEAPFMLVLPVPDGVNLSLAEFDVQAFGVSE